MGTDLTAGWSAASGSNAAHYFEDGRPICGGFLVPASKPRVDGDCPACLAQLNAGEDIPPIR